jgi:ketosteroid isomerase-like protein
MKAFREAIEARDVEALEELLADDVVFRSPAVHKPYEGKLATSVVLRAVMRVFEDFRYTRTMGAEADADQVLVFEARVGDRSIEGADFLHVRADGLIDDFRVMIRPLSGLTAVVEAMQAALPDVMQEMGLS